MDIGEYTEKDFYPLVEAGMEDAVDRVATLGEWAACKAAIYKWIEKIDGQADALAMSQETGER